MGKMSFLKEKRLKLTPMKLQLFGDSHIFFDEYSISTKYSPKRCKVQQSTTWSLFVQSFPLSSYITVALLRIQNHLSRKWLFVGCTIFHGLRIYLCSQVYAQTQIQTINSLLNDENWCIDQFSRRSFAVMSFRFPITTEWDLVDRVEKWSFYACFS